jgi:hypothetical protein
MTEVFLDQENRTGRSVANLPKSALLHLPFPQEIRKKINQQEGKPPHRVFESSVQLGLRN